MTLCFAFGAFFSPCFLFNIHRLNTVYVHLGPKTDRFVRFLFLGFRAGSAHLGSAAENSAPLSWTKFKTDAIWRFVQHRDKSSGYLLESLPYLTLSVATYGMRGLRLQSDFLLHRRGPVQSLEPPEKIPNFP